MPFVLGGESTLDNELIRSVIVNADAHRTEEHGPGKIWVICRQDHVPVFGIGDYCCSSANLVKSRDRERKTSGHEHAQLQELCPDYSAKSPGDGVRARDE